MTGQNGHCKRTRQTLEALDFRLDDDACRPGVFVYRHANAPEKALRVFAGISDMAARKVRLAAGEIAGYSVVGESQPHNARRSAKEKSRAARVKRDAEASRAARERAAYQAEADARRARSVERQRDRAKRDEHARRARATAPIVALVVEARRRQRRACSHIQVAEFVATALTLADIEREFGVRLVLTDGLRDALSQLGIRSEAAA